MSRLETRHLSQEEMLKLADGELPGSAQARAHLEACWQCRADFEELQASIGELIRYRKSAWQPYAPPPPAPWADLRPRFQQADAGLANRPLFTRLAGWFSSTFRPPTRWAPAAVAMLAMAAIIYQFWDTPRVEAAVILRKAVDAAAVRPASAKRLDIRQGGRPAEPAAVEALFRAAHYDWRNPLSAKAYLDWFDQLSQKQEEVISDPDSASAPAWLIRTTTRHSELVQATLLLSRDDWQALEGTFQFRGQELIRIRELAAEPAAETLSTAAAPPPPAAGAPAAPPSRTASPSPGDELRVTAALHRISADLGDPVDIARSFERILITGVGIPAERRRQIQEAVGAMPFVELQFQEPAASSSLPSASRRISSTRRASPFQQQLEQQLGGRPALDQFTDLILDATDQMMSQAHALRRLAERFPRAVETSLPPEDRALLDKLRGEHAAALRELLARIHADASPVLRALSAQPSPAPAPQLQDWQASTSRFFETARRMERLFTILLGGATADSGAPDEAGLPSELLASLHQLTQLGQALEPRP
ncbi:MAG: hypothetical protein FJW20_06285 [Acidimicrobiia bacterium]|nr:hypothetical protein [Acidimicrobiia bacterium]